ncbi:hypothetical protein [Roseomonas indoligenes]|uniref:Uncharacterized protein n=1 Tax=Roseomonas indoligenes TaxID=2820811 RepID=A0A940N2L2_9PROT|nr:hypothetical protein [Pararoseomonas indoligenes]MBP0494045.1 hypothetical protein [Pararoseomonas indoligenes]
MRPLTVYALSFAALAAGLALVLLVGGVGRAVGVVLILGGALGAVVTLSRPEAAEQGRRFTPG